MRATDIRTGEHYAYRSAGSDLPSRVEAVAEPSGAAVEVYLHLARGPRGDRRLRPGSIIRVPTLHLIDTWSGWLTTDAAAHDRALPADSPELRADRLFRVRPEWVPEPDRPLPDGYATLGPLSRRISGPADLPDHAVEQLSTTPAMLLRWCTGLPVAVARDVVAAATRRGFPTNAGSVGSVFARSGGVLAALLTRHSELLDSFPTVTAADVPFAAANAPSPRSVPWEPQLPSEVLALWSQVFTASPPGWMRVGLIAPDGTFHRPGCTVTTPTFRSGPLWRMLLAGTRHCRGCAGAGLLPDRSLLAFTAASDFWQARGARGIGERWQLEAVADAYEFAAAEQARTQHPDDGDAIVTLLARKADPLLSAGRARALLAASTEWRRLSDVQKDRTIIEVDRVLDEAAVVLGADRHRPDTEDRADAARRLRRRVHALAVHAAVADEALAAMLFTVHQPPSGGTGPAQ